MDIGVWIAIAGLALGNGSALLATIIRRAKWEQKMEGRVAEVEKGLEHGRERFSKLDEKVEGVKEDTQEIKLQVTEIAVLLRAHMERNGQAGG
jgi:hypothetical protein